VPGLDLRRRSPQHVGRSSAIDGNTSDNDECPGNCRQAGCGDGFTWEPYEECDDGNTSNADGCLEQLQARVLRRRNRRGGVEICDDGDVWSGNTCTEDAVRRDAATVTSSSASSSATIPTGELYHGKCSADCKLIEACSDADGSGTTTTSDALKILRYSVDLDRNCTPDRCDLNGTGRITAIDASAALRDAAGLSVVLQCPIPGKASFVLEDSRNFGALQVSVDFSGTNIGFGHDGLVGDCELRVPDALFASAVVPQDILNLGWISRWGFRGPDRARALHESTREEATTRADRTASRSRSSTRPIRMATTWYRLRASSWSRTESPLGRTESARRSGRIPGLQLPADLKHLDLRPPSRRVARSRNSGRRDWSRSSA